MYENGPDHLSNKLRSENLYTYLFSIRLQNKQKHITNSCRNNFWSKPILMLSKREFKVLMKKSGREAFRVSFKFPRRGRDQRLADLNGF